MNIEKERKETAIHECGHAITGRLLGMPVQIVTVMPHGYSEGKTISEFEKGNRLEFRKNQLVQGFGGIAAEEIFGISIGGTEKDLAGTTRIALELIAIQGQGYKIKNISLASINNEDFGREGIYPRDVSEQLKINLEDDLFRMLETSREKAYSILSNYGKKKIEYVADKIIENNFVVQKDLDKIMKEAEKIG